MPPRKRSGSGGISRRAAIALIGGGGLLAISSSGAFDQVDADRPFELAVDDETAVLGIDLDVDDTSADPPKITVTEENQLTQTVLTLTNRFPESSDIDEEEVEFSTIEIEPEPDPDWFEILEIEESDLPLKPQDYIDIEGDISESHDRGEVTLKISASEEDDEGDITTRIETDRTIDIEVDLPMNLPPACPINLEEEAQGDQTGGGETTIEENVDGNVEIFGELTIIGKGDFVKVTGFVFSPNEIMIDNAKIGGYVEGLNDITIKNESTVCGDIDSDGNVTIDASDVVNINADGLVTIEQQSCVYGDIDTNGDVNIRNHATVCGNINASDGTVTLWPNALVKGNINASEVDEKGGRGQGGGNPGADDCDC